MSANCYYSNKLTLLSQTILKIVCFVGARRIHGVNTYFFNTGNAKKETRGGNRQTNDTSIITFIQKLEVCEGHYGRALRQYLPVKLSVSKLWRMWKSERNRAHLPTTSRPQFSKLFNTKFNLSFRNPRVDVCSQCEIYKNRLVANVDVEINQVAWDLHKARAKRFYQLLRESVESSQT